MTSSNDVPDQSNGWDAIAPEFIRDARRTRIGVDVVTRWANQVPPGSTFLDLGCGPGTRRSDPLHEFGVVYAVDASPRLLRTYAARFPDAMVACEPAEDSAFFDRKFDAVLAWGLLFLLTPNNQEEVIRRIAKVLNPHGTFLFTAPQEAATWIDNSTGRESISLGLTVYRELLTAVGLTLVRHHVDDGRNHYYEAARDDDDLR